MGIDKKQIYFLCPGIEWDNPTTGGLLYNYVFIKALKQRFGDEAVVPVNLIGHVQPHSWLKQRVGANFKYLIYLAGMRLGKNDIVLVDSRSNSLLLLPLLYLRYFSNAKIGMTVYHIYCHLSDRKGFIGVIEKFCEKYFIYCASLIITISKSTLREITKLTGRKDSAKVPIRIIPPGLKVDKVTTREGKSLKEDSSVYKLLYVGNCEDPRKGLDYLLQAIAEIPSQQLRLFLIGKYDETSDYHGHLVKTIEQCKVSKKVQFLGRVSDEKLNQLYFDSDIFVFPSLWEGYGIVLAEAMANGLPVIATNISAIPEIVRDGVNGILVPPGNVDFLSAAIVRLIDDNELRKEMSVKSREIAKNFKSWEEVGRSLTQLIQDFFVTSKS